MTLTSRRGGSLCRTGADRCPFLGSCNNTHQYIHKHSFSLSHTHGAGAGGRNRTYGNGFRSARDLVTVRPLPGNRSCFNDGLLASLSSRVIRRPSQIHPQLPVHHPRLAHLLPAHRARAERPRLAALEQGLVPAYFADAVPARHDAHPRAAAKAHEALIEPLIVLLLLLFLFVLLFKLLLLLLLCPRPFRYPAAAAATTATTQRTAPDVEVALVVVKLE